MAEKQFDPYPWSLRTLVDKNFYIVPVYQRPYSWTKEQVSSLLNDLFSAYNVKESHPNETMFTGTLFLRHAGKGKDGVKERYEVVDGQQRITTFSMILLSIYSLAIARGLSAESKKISDLKSFLWKYSDSEDSFLKEEPLLSLSSIDKEAFKFVMNTCYEDPKHLMGAINNYVSQCWTEENVFSMLKLIYSSLGARFPESEIGNESLMSFLSYILDKTLFIVIQSSIDIARVFSVFESINSKGKPLETIDLIKTYIFSQLDISDYDLYLSKWGQLIIKTKDKLDDYLQVYIKAFHAYYHQAINIQKFKSVAKELVSFYGVSSIKDALKTLINDMLDKVDSYALLYDQGLICSKINKSSFELFYSLYKINGYQHPASLLFKALTELEQGLLNKDELISILKSSTMFMFKEQSINGGDSKDAIEIFDKIATHFYGSPKLNAEWIAEAFEEELIIKGIDKTTITRKFMALDFYTKHDLSYSILCLLESIDSKTHRLLFKQASFMLNSMKTTIFALDHMLPQNPNKDNPSLKYYPEYISGKKCLVLKEGHDFPEDVISGMEYDQFEKRSINKLGNLRLYLAQLNSIKGNETLILPGKEEFTTYKQIMDRCEALANLLFSCPDLN